jgi:hypothetical protein
MEFLSDLWLPIILVTIVLFFASFVAWMVLPHHFGDWKRLEHEKEIMDAVLRHNIAAGNYMFPHPETKQQQNSAEFQARYARGPRGVLTLWKVPNMGVNLGLTVLFFFVTTAMIAYVTHVACPPRGSGVDFWKVFRVSGTIGMLVHGSSGVLNAIWFRRRIGTDIIDGIVYGLLLGLIMGWLWPTI